MMTPMEMIVLVDQDGRQIGTAPKLASHHSDTPLHRAFSCYIFSGDGKFLVTRRALVKKVWPGVWTNSVCGHPGPGEATKAAIVRRSKYELGLDVGKIQNILPKYIYKTPPFKGVIEHEFCPIFVAIAGSKLAPNPEEVGDYKWMRWTEYSRALVQEASKYSYWSKDQYSKLMFNPAFQEFLKQF
jgi:isopentenyl-diphosphate delta-isomerase